MRLKRDRSGAHELQQGCENLLIKLTFLALDVELNALDSDRHLRVHVRQPAHSLNSKVVA